MEVDLKFGGLQICWRSSFAFLLSDENNNFTQKQLELFTVQK